MKQNVYNNEKFFEKYSQMRRSVMGLKGAGEWQTLQNLLPDFNGKRVLDLGCGYGWHCEYAMKQGAKSVTGVDISDKMLAVARVKTSKEINYICEPIEDVQFPNHAFDVVLSSLAFHYLRSFEEIAGRVFSWLDNGGEFVFSVEHPIFTAHGSQDWHRDSEGNKLHFPVDNYCHEGKRETEFLGEKVTKYHRTLTTYVNSLLEKGFRLTRVVEPMPSKEMMEEVEGMTDELRRPMMLIVAAEKV